MKCPRTGSPLKTIKVGGVSVQVSEQCGGAFFDNLALSNFECSSSRRGNALTEHLKKFSVKLANENERIKCPKCTDIVMMRRYYSPLKVIEIDECPGCAGIWLDTGELEKIQINQLSAAELNHLRREMVEQTTPAKIESLSHKYSNYHGRDSHLHKLVELTTQLFSG